GLTLQERELGGNSVEVAGSLCELASVSEHPEAIKLYERAISINEKSPDAKRLGEALCLASLAGLYIRDDRLDDYPKFLDR
ncbi:tetratricopeptide repeat protein, partial [Acinetobacter baumannii]